MRFTFPLLSVTALVLVIACQSNKTEERTNAYSDVPKTHLDSLKKEVIDGHDIGMGKMMRIENYLKKIDLALDSLSNLPANKVDTAYRSALTSLKQDLVDAEDGMNKWMEGFSLDSTAATEEKTIEYFEGEKSKVKKVTDDILAALQRADSLIKKN